MRTIAALTAAVLVGIAIGVAACSFESPPTLGQLDVQSSTVQNKWIATALADNLISAVHPTRGAVPIRAFTYAHVGFGYLAPWTEQQSRYWRLPAPITSIDALISPLAGIDRRSCAHGTGGGPAYATFGVECPIDRGTEMLNVLELDGSPGGPVELGAYAAVSFGPGKPATASITFPVSRVTVRTVTIFGHRLDHGVVIRDAESIAALVQAVNGLPTSPPVFSCNLEVGPDDPYPQVEFEPDATGAPSYTITIGPCDEGIEHSFGRQQPALTVSDHLLGLIQDLAPREIPK